MQGAELSLGEPGPASLDIKGHSDDRQGFLLTVLSALRNYTGKHLVGVRHMAICHKDVWHGLSCGLGGKFFLI